MISITIEQHTALLAAFDALLEKHLAAAVRRDLQSTEYLDKQYNVIRDLIDQATIEVEDAQTPDDGSFNEFLVGTVYWLYVDFEERISKREGVEARPFDVRLEFKKELGRLFSLLAPLTPTTVAAEAGDAPTPDTTPLWRDSDREDWMRDGSIHLELVADPGVAAHFGSWDFVPGTYVAIETADEMVHVESEHLPALIAMLQEVQRRIEAGDAA